MVQDFSWLQKAVLTMGKTTITGVEKAIQALLCNDMTAAADAREIEKKIDAMYYAVNEHCMSRLADTMHTRSDVNFVVCSLKIAMELERIGDYANQIAKIVQRKLSHQDVNSFKTMNCSAGSMRDQSLEMLKDALRAYEQGNPDAVQIIKAQDESVDKSNKDLYRNMLCIVSVNSWVQEAVMDYHIAIRYIERVADRATNIAEQVYYIAHSESVKKKPVQEDIWND